MPHQGRAVYNLLTFPRSPITMNKRTFLNVLGGAIAGCKIAPAFAGLAGKALTNWAGNFEFGTSNVHEAKSLEQVRTNVGSLEKLKVIGTRHCFNRIADSRDNLLSL